VKAPVQVSSLVLVISLSLWKLRGKRVRAGKAKISLHKKARKAVE